MERFSLKESALSASELSQKLAEEKIKVLEHQHMPMIHDALGSDGWTPLLNLIASQLIGPLGLL